MVTSRTVVVPRGWGHYAGVPVSPQQRSLIADSVRRNFSQLRTQARLQNAGIGLRNAAIGQVRREEQGKPATRVAFESVRGEFRPTANSITLTRFNTATKYRYTARANIRNPLDSVIHQQRIVFGDDTLLSKDQIMSRARDISAQAQGGYRLEDGGSEFGETLGIDLIGIEERLF